MEKGRARGKIENGIPLRPPTPRFHVTENGRNGPLVVLQPVLRRGKGGSTIRMVKVLRRRGRSGGAHIEGREGAACPDALCPDNDDDGDHHDGHHVAEVPAPSWIPVSACRWVHALPSGRASISIFHHGDNRYWGSFPRNKNIWRIVVRGCLLRNFRIRVQGRGCLDSCEESFESERQFLDF